MMTSIPDPSPLRLAVLISGGGTTLENLAERIVAERLPASIELVLSSRGGVFGLERARRLGLRTAVVERAACPSVDAFATEVWRQIREADVGLVCLAGFLSLLPIPDDFAGRVINIHPALLPAFGGKGMYGQRVHQAVIDAGCKVSGCTVHFADSTYDTGPILLQRCCPVAEDDTAQSLADRVFQEECQAYPEAIKLIAQGRVMLQGRRVRIAPPSASDARSDREPA